jgi:hypothetical protein
VGKTTYTGDSATLKHYNKACNSLFVYSLVASGTQIICKCVAFVVLVVSSMGVVKLRHCFGSVRGPIGQKKQASSYVNCRERRLMGRVQQGWHGPPICSVFGLVMHAARDAHPTNIDAYFAPPCNSTPRCRWKKPLQS